MSLLRQPRMSRSSQKAREPALSRSFHILIVDDDRRIRAGLCRFLTSQGLRVSQSKDGEEMFNAFEAGNIDLIVLDVMLPGDDGFALCRKLRAESEVPIVLLTARIGRPTARIVSSAVSVSRVKNPDSARLPYLLSRNSM